LLIDVIFYKPQTCLWEFHQIHNHNFGVFSWQRRTD